MKMKKKRETISKAVVLLAVVIMITSMIPVAIANTNAGNLDLPTEDSNAPPKNLRMHIDNPKEKRPHPMTHFPMEASINNLGTQTIQGPSPFTYEQTQTTGTSDITAINIAEGYAGIDNFFGLPENAIIQTVSYTGLSAYYDGGWLPCNPSELTFTISFYSQSSSIYTMPPTGLVSQFDFDVGEYTYTLQPGNFEGYLIYEWTFELPSDVSLEEGWIKIEETNDNDVGSLWIESQDGDMFSYQVGGSPQDFDLTFTLSGISNFVCQPGICDLRVLNVVNIGDGETINSVPKNINLTISNSGDISITDAKILIDIYEKTCGETNITFDDDMESYNPLTQSDNVNWTPIDNGDGDTWTLLCNDESHSGSQAYRCTLGQYRQPCDGTDCYLGHAANSGPDMLQMDNPIDLSNTACATLSFWHKCTGEYTTDEDDNIIPIDYGTIQYSINGGISWIDLPEFIAYDNAWQEIVVKFVDTAFHDSNCPACDEYNADYVVETSLNNADLLIRFVWQTDPSQQYEGWYIDDVKIEKTEQPNFGVPVWQGWQIVEVPGCTPEQSVIFPINFVGEVGTCYQLNVIAQVFDCDDADLSNNELSIQFCVDDLHDMSTTNIVGPSVLNGGDDATYDVTVKNVGSFAENNVPVELQISKAELMTSNSIDDDFESSPNMWRSGYFTCKRPLNLWRWSSEDSYSGTHSMFCTNDANMLEPDIGCLLTPDIIFDFRDDNIISSTLSYNIKWSIPCDGAWEDYFGIGFGHPDNNWVVTSTYPAFSGGYDNEWRGPQNPGPWPIEMFQWNLKEIMDSLVATIPDIFPDARLQLYFVVATNDNTNILNADNPEYWSGVMLDDVEIKTTRTSSTNTITLDTKTTGILNPGESETLTMYWNNSQYCNWMVSGVTQLAGDVNTGNDAAYTQTMVRDVSTDISFESVDLTGFPEDSMWQIVDKQSFDPEPTTDSYWWCGKEYTTWGGYANNMDDSLITEPFDLSDSSYSTGASFSFDTWYEFADPYDYGEIFYSPDNGTTWKHVGKLSGTDDWHVVQYGIPAQDCTDLVRLKFRMVSDDEGVSNGWYIDDLTVDNLPSYQRDVYYEGFNITEFRWTTNPSFDNHNWVLSDTQWAGGTTTEIKFKPYSYEDDAWIELGPFDTTGYTTLDFTAQTYIDEWHKEGHRIQVRTDTGTESWTNIVYNENIPAGTSDARHDISKTLDVLAGVGSPTLKIRLYFISGYDDISAWYIDNVALGSIAYEDFTPDWIETRGWTLTHFNSDFYNQGVVDPSPFYIPTTWAPASLYRNPYEGNDLAGLYNDVSVSHHPPLRSKQKEHMQSPLLTYTLTGDEFLTMVVRSDNQAYVSAKPEQDLIRSYNGTAWNDVADLAQMGTHHFGQPLFIPLPSDTQKVDFYRYAQGGGNAPWYIDDMSIEVYVPGTTTTFGFEEGEAYYLERDWKTEANHAGDFWQQDISCPFGDYNGDGLAHACIDYPNYGTGLDDSLYTVIDLTDTDNLSYAEYQFAISYYVKANSGCAIYVELSSDYDPSETMSESSAHWETIVTNGEYSSSNGWLPFDFYLNDYLGKTVTIRFRLTTPGNGVFTPYTTDDAGYWVDDFALITKQKPAATDVLPPTTVIVFDDSGATPTATLLAADQAGPVVSGVAATYYTLNGGSQQTYTAPFTLSEGSNTVVFWSVDNAGNTETHKTATHTVDTTPPTLTITSPENGFYLFGNKLFNLNNRVFCIGKVAIEADASDISGINMVTFNVDGSTGYDADGSDGYTYFYSDRHFGSLDITVTAYDNNGLSAEDTITITVFSLGL